MSTTRPPSRLVSLDVFRGATIAAMLLVNNPGSWSHVYPPLRHAAWHGWTPTDLIFPFFLFIMGTAMAFSLRRYQRGSGTASPPIGRLVWRVGRRVVVLIALGLVLSGFPTSPEALPGYDLSEMRLPGVLQRIGLVYLFAVPMVVWLSVRAQVAVSGAILAAYWALLTFVPIDGFAPAMEPMWNPARVIDRAVLGDVHLYGGSPTDPEGLLSTLPAVVTCLMGYWAGRTIRGCSARASGDACPRGCAMRRLIWSGLAVAAAGQVLGLFHPINKPLWTATYVLLTGGLAAACLGALHWAIDRRGWQGWWSTPIEQMGINAITAFVGSGLLARILLLVRLEADGQDGPREVTLKQWVYEWIITLGLREVDASLVFAMLTVGVWMLILWVLERVGWRVRV